VTFKKTLVFKEPSGKPGILWGLRRLGSPQHVWKAHFQTKESGDKARGALFQSSPLFFAF